MADWRARGGLSRGLNLPDPCCPADSSRPPTRPVPKLGERLVDRGGEAPAVQGVESG